MKNDNSTKQSNASKPMLGDGFVSASELRLGNYVNVPREDQCPFRIDAFEALSNKFIKVAMIHPAYGENFHPLTWYGEDLKPIPLNNEWFEKLIAGFTNGSNKENHRWIAFHNMHLDIYYNEKEQYYYYHTNQLQSIKILYVHKFQNLIFELSNRELTIA